MSAISRWSRVGGALAVWFAVGPPVGAQAPLEVDHFVEIVLRAHPSALHRAGLERAAVAESRAARVVPDPVFEYSRGRARAIGGIGPRSAENGYSVSQTLPWPGTFGAGIRAGDRAADALRAGAEGMRWEMAGQARKAYARLAAARVLLDVARAAEVDARALRDLVARRADLGEARESDRIKATVEWLRQQRDLAAAEREAGSSEAIVRALAVEPLPDPLSLRPPVYDPLPALDRDALVAQIVDHSPRVRATQAEAERQQALLSGARRARIPDLDVSVFRDKELDKEGTGFKVGVKVPIWSGNRGEIARADAAKRIAEAEVGRVRIELVTELQGRLKELQTAGDQVFLLDRELLPAADRSVELVRISFEEGETSLLDLLDAQRTFRDTQRESVESRLAFSLALADVQIVAGPDFNPWR